MSNTSTHTEREYLSPIDTNTEVLHTQTFEVNNKLFKSIKKTNTQCISRVLVLLSCCVFSVSAAGCQKSYKQDSFKVSRGHYWAVWFRCSSRNQSWRPGLDKESLSDMAVIHTHCHMGPVCRQTKRLGNSPMDSEVKSIYLTTIGCEHMCL